MTKNGCRFMGLLFVMIVALALTLPAGRVKREQVPAAVLRAFAASYPNALVKGYSSEKQDGKTCYEIESMEGQNSRDLLYAADGKVIEMEEGLRAADLPPVITDAVSRKYPEGKIKKAERLTRGEFVGYEIAVTVGSKTVEMALDKNGQPQPEKKKGDAKPPKQAGKK